MVFVEFCHSVTQHMHTRQCSRSWANSIEKDKPCQVQWCVPVVPAPQEAEQEDSVSSWVLGCGMLGQLGVCAKFGINMVTSQEWETTRLPKEG